MTATYGVATGVRLADLPLLGVFFSRSAYRVLNPSLELVQNRKDLRVLSQTAQLIVVNHEEACAYLDKDPTQFNPQVDVDLFVSSLQAQSAIVTWNSRGAFYLERGGELIPARANMMPTNNDGIEDNVGAGDFFLAAFLRNFKKTDIQYAMNFAATAAHLKVHCVCMPGAITNKVVEYYM